MTNLPTHAQAVIIGGGIVGVSSAYHLTQLGWKDVVLLEQGKLTCGTTWHAAGLIGQLRATRNMTRMSRYGIDLYANLEAETGLATGWKQCGSLTVARTPERVTLLRRTLATARGFGVEADFISLEAARERWPLMRIDDLQGAVWIPGDGKANPTDLTQSLAKGARSRGASIIEGVRLLDVIVEGGRVRGVATGQGEIRCEALLNCSGQWARDLGRKSGVNIPLHSAEHFYIVSKPIAGVTPDLPVLRDPDGYIYFKEEVGGLVMGGFEPAAKPWGMNGIPENFEFQLLPDDWEQFQVLMESALIRAPCLESAQIKFFCNGPESFTPDGNFILGEAPEVRGYFVAAGFNSSGIANAGGAGRLIAEWMVNGNPGADLWDVDIRRFAPFNANRAALRDRTVEALGLHYAMRWPRQELVSARPLRRSPLYDRLKAKGARFGSKFGWERASYFAPPGSPDPAHTFGKPGWLQWEIEEQLAVRNDVVIFDQTSFTKFLLQGRDALAVLQRICANDVDVAHGRMVYTALLNERGGFESDLTITRLGETQFFIVTGTAQATRDRDWIERHIVEGEFAVLTDVTSAYAVLSLMGPRARGLLAKVSPGDLSDARFGFSTTREIDVGYARVRAARMSYVGGPGFELYIPVEMALCAYEALCDAGPEFGLRDAGYYALDALRIEAGRRAFGAELGPDDTPFEAGLGYAVKLERPGDFIGKSALLKQKQTGIERRLVIFTIDDAGAFAWGGEPILRDGKHAGEVTSAGYSGALGRMVLMGYVRTGEIIDDEAIFTARYEVAIAGERIAATPCTTPPYPAQIVRR